MKGKCKTLCLILLVCLTASSAFGDASTVALQSIILDNFDGTEYKIDGETYVYTWQVAGSRYSTKAGDITYPRSGYIQTSPVSLDRLAKADGKEAVSLGVQGSFDRHGYNWIDIYPSLQGGDGSPVEIPLWGRTRFIDIWVWGSNLNYNLTAYIRDNRGIVHEVSMGNLKYSGWKNLRATIPVSIPMVSTVLPRSTHSSTFVKFRITTNPNERTAIERDRNGNVVPFNVYMAQLKVLNDIYESFYDGDELADPKKTDALWSAAGNGQ
jgi:hypothetical protein